ncbi:MAG: CPBP family intramembrane metalloprotease [Lachnospira sp.]|nr:CPBP family intramembrane metalloprotease [Lachnospira sp.]
MNTSVDKKYALKQLMLFLIIALPVTWIFMGVALHISDGMVETKPLSNLLYILACFMPAIAGLLVCIITKDRIRSLMFLPKLQGNVKAYSLAIVGGVLISVMSPFIICLFPEVGKFNSEVSVWIVIFSAIQAVVMCCIQFFALMGEEIGWMGLVFPRLEKICGTTLGIIITGIIRGLWHMALFFQDGKFLWEDFGMLMFNNIVGGCLLVLLTKMSGSVVPSAIFHGITNTLPGVLYMFMIVDPAAYENKELMLEVIAHIPYVIIMAICFVVLKLRYSNTMQRE